MIKPCQHPSALLPVQQACSSAVPASPALPMLTTTFVVEKKEPQKPKQKRKLMNKLLKRF